MEKKFCYLSINDKLDWLYKQLKSSGCGCVDDDPVVVVPPIPPVVTPPVVSLGLDCSSGILEITVDGTTDDTDLSCLIPTIPPVVHPIPKFPIFPCMRVPGTGHANSHFTSNMLLIHAGIIDPLQDIEVYADTYYYASVQYTLPKIVIGWIMAGDNFITIDPAGKNQYEAILRNKLIVDHSNPDVLVMITTEVSNKILVINTTGMAQILGANQGFAVELKFDNSTVLTDSGNGYHVAGTAEVNITWNGMKYTDGSATYDTIEDVMNQYPRAEIC